MSSTWTTQVTGSDQYPERPCRPAEVQVIYLITGSPRRHARLRDSTLRSGAAADVYVDAAATSAAKASFVINCREMAVVGETAAPKHAWNSAVTSDFLLVYGLTSYLQTGAMSLTDVWYKYTLLKHCFHIDNVQGPHYKSPFCQLIMRDAGMHFYSSENSQLGYTEYIQVKSSQVACATHKHQRICEKITRNRHIVFIRDSRKTFLLSETE